MLCGDSSWVYATRPKAASLARVAEFVLSASSTSHLEMVTAPGSVLFGAAPSPQEANGTPLNGANGASTSGPAGAQNDPVAFDASTELTDYLVSSYSTTLDRIRVLKVPSRRSRVQHQSFVSADFSDVTLNVHYDPNLPELISTFNLHAIFLGRSPFLRNLCAPTCPPPSALLKKKPAANPHPRSQIQVGPVLPTTPHDPSPLLHHPPPGPHHPRSPPSRSGLPVHPLRDRALVNLRLPLRPRHRRLPRPQHPRVPRR